MLSLLQLNSPLNILADEMLILFTHSYFLLQANMTYFTYKLLKSRGKIDKKII